MSTGNLSVALNESIGSLFADACRLVAARPSYSLFALRTLWRQSRAARRRLAWEECGTHVPPFMIVSVTGRCNLACKGCYAHHLQPRPAAELDAGKLRSVFSEAKSLGVSVIILAGGEPLLRPDLLTITKDYPDIIFPLFTNGLLMNNEVISTLKKQKNVIPVISFEGDGAQTDQRRGGGVFDKLDRLLADLRKAKLFFGVSLTVSRGNFDVVSSENFVQQFIAKGSRLFFFVEYVPVKPGTEAMVLTGHERLRLKGILQSFRSKFPSLFVGFPLDEQEFGGCLAAGRGFVHVNARGDLEPCPFAPYSDTNIAEMSLKAGLQSELFAAIRQDHELREEHSGGCALWAKRDWVGSLLAAKAA